MQVWVLTRWGTWATTGFEVVQGTEQGCMGPAGGGSQTSVALAEQQQLSPLEAGLGPD